jgi:hypothetical protein
MYIKRTYCKSPFYFNLILFYKIFIKEDIIYLLLIYKTIFEYYISKIIGAHERNIIKKLPICENFGSL